MRLDDLLKAVVLSGFVFSEVFLRELRLSERSIRLISLVLGATVLRGCGLLNIILKLNIE